MPSADPRLARAILLDAPLADLEDLWAYARAKSDESGAWARETLAYLDRPR